MAFDLNQFLSSLTGPQKAPDTMYETAANPTPIPDIPAEVVPISKQVSGSKPIAAPVSAPIVSSSVPMDDSSDNADDEADMSDNMEVTGTQDAMAASNPAGLPTEQTYADKLKAAMAERDSKLSKAYLINGIGELFNYMGATKSKQAPAKIDSTVDMVKKIGDQGVIDIANLEAANLKDPNSSISKQYRAAAKKMGLDIPEGTTAETIKSVMPNLIQMKNLEEREREHQDMLNFKYAALKERTQNALASRKNELSLNQQMNQDFKQKKLLDKEVGQIANRYEKDGLPVLAGTLSDVNDVLNKYGVKVGDIDSKADLPAIGMIDSKVPSFMLSDDGAALKSRIATLSNSLLKMRSGTAVTDPEHKRLYEELGTGNLQNNRSVLTGLKYIKDDLSRISKNIEAVEPETKNEYKSRTGLPLMSEALDNIGKTKGIQPETGMVKIINPNGKVGMVSKDKLDDAIKAGGALIQ